MERLNPKDMLADVIELIKEAADLIPKMRTEMTIETKANRNDLVTDIDKEIENFIASKLKEVVDYPILGEESHHFANYDNFVWLLDPIDGTLDFIETEKNYSISLALYQNKQPVLAAVYDVEKNIMYSAIHNGGAWINGESIKKITGMKSYKEMIILTGIKEIIALPRLLTCIKESRGHRRYGSAALECIDVALGKAGAFVHLYVSPWDIAAAKIICEEAGCLFTRLDGTRIDISEKGSVLVGGNKVHEELLQKLVIDSES